MVKTASVVEGRLGIRLQMIFEDLMQLTRLGKLDMLFVFRFLSPLNREECRNFFLRKCHARKL